MTTRPFRNRWLIQGKFVTKSELHIGDGGEGALHDRSRDATSDESDASTVCVDHQQRAYIPGSAVKGVLRALVLSGTNGSARDTRPWRELFGAGVSDTQGVGGKLEFCDAFHCTPASGAVSSANVDIDRNRPWWDDARKTAVAASVSLDRRTRTAKRNLLYHLEYVPPGEEFAFNIAGVDLSVDEVAHILNLLDQFSTGLVTLGSRTSDGWGHVACLVQEIRCIRAGEELENWKRNPAAGLQAMGAPISRAEKELLEQAKRRLGSVGDGPHLMTIGLTLHIESPWLVRDPRQDERKRNSSKEPDTVPLKNENGHCFLPASSARGVLRSRAEMILRTLGHHCADHPGDIGEVTTKGHGTEAVLRAIETKDLAARLFGFGGWKAPLRVTRFTGTKQTEERRQEFVAIDRYSGGSSGSKKFQAMLAQRNDLCGELQIDLARLRRVDSSLASVGLLALVLRDLEEGDLHVGSGSAKGLGACRATITVDDSAAWKQHAFIAAGVEALRSRF